MSEDKTNIHILELSNYSQPEIVEDSKNNWVEYGADNMYYNWLISRYKGSTTNNSIINNVARLIYGKGLHALDASRKPNEFAMMKSLFKPKMLRSAGLNEYMLGCGVLQCIFDDKHTKVIRVETVKTKHVRPEKCNKDGEIEAYYYSDNWEETRKFPPKRIPAFGTSKEPIEFLVYGKDSIDLKYFSEVDYQACLPYCLLEEEISNYLINDTQNGFSGTKVINFSNGIPTEEQQRIISNKVKGKLTGATGDKVIVAFNNNAESKTTVEDIPLNDAPEHYQYLSDEAQGKILNNHNVVSPMIVGITTANSGFSSNGDEIETATRFFYNQTVKPHQELLIDALDEILAFNGVALKLYFKNLNLLDVLGEEPKQEEAEFKLSHWLDAYGENETEDWELIDAREVDYDLEDSFNSQIAEMEAKLQDNKTNFLSKIYNLATGTASPNNPSSQDKEVNGFYFKVRYKYVGNGSPERGFCKDMMRAAKVYRKEDIEKLSLISPNKGFGEGGADTYSIWLYKGGARCHHKWERRTYVSASKTASIGSAKTNQISTNKARKFGYRVAQEKQVAMMPNDMPLKGFSPNNPNLPSDVQ